MVVTLEDLHSIPNAGKVGYCHPGTRKLLSRHGISWEVFRTKGLLAADYAHIDDPFISKLIAHAAHRRGY